MSIGRNTLVNLAGQLVPVAVSLLAVPAYLHMIGEARYGVLLLVWMFLGYFGLFDFGLSRAVAQKVAELRDDQTGARNRVVWTALVLAGGLSVVGGIILYLAGGHGLERCFGAEIALRGEFLSALPWVALILPANLLGGTLSGALQGRERFVDLNVIQAVGTIWAQLVPMIVARFWSVDLFWLLPAALSGRLVTGLWTFVICRRHVPLTTRPAFDRSLIKSLFSFGGWVTVSSIVSPILTTFDRFVISLMGGPTAVTYYGVPFGIVSRLLVLPTALSGAVFPRFANGDTAARQQLLAQSTGALAAVFTPVSLGMIFLIGPFLSVWVGSELASKGTLVGELMIVGFWFNGLGFLPHAYLQANARPRISAVFHLAELVPYLLLLWLGLILWGVAGAALAGSLRMIADTVLHYWASGRGRAVWRELVVPALTILAGLGTVMAFDAGDFRRWLAAAGLLLVLGVWGWGRLPEGWRQRISFPMLRKKDA